MQHYDHAMCGAVLALASGAQRRFGPAIVVTAAAAAALPDWDDLPGGVHRIWGHSLLIAPVASGLVGALGYLCYRSARRRRGSAPVPPGLATWVLIGVLASLTHILADLAYSGRYLTAEWPVALFWPVRQQRWAFPLVPWADRGLTILFATALATACLLPSRARTIGAVTLLAAVAYVGLWGVGIALAGKFVQTTAPAHRAAIIRTGARAEGRPCPFTIGHVSIPVSSTIFTTCGSRNCETRSTRGFCPPAFMPYRNSTPVGTSQTC